MAIQDQTTAHPTVFVDTFTDGLLGPDVEMLGPVADGGHIVWNPAPGCWGPMITPVDPRRPRGLHARSPSPAPRSATRSRSGSSDIAVTSSATASGNDQAMEGRFNGDPYCAAGLRRLRRRVARDAARRHRRGAPCAAPRCGADATPFTFTNGYTIAFDERRRVGVTLPREPAEALARDAARAAALPEHSVQNPILAFAPHDIVALATRLRPFLGQLGTTPSATIPDSHNAGDFGAFLVGAPHRYALDAQALQRHKTDGHLDIDAVRAGAVLVCPVKVPGGGVYLGDMHALAGRRRDRRPHGRRVRHGHAAGRGAQGPRDRRAGAVPGRRGPAVPGPAAQRRRARAGARAGPPPRHRRARGVAADLA